jgi:hypothetical protein
MISRNFSSTVWYPYPDIFENVWFFRWQAIFETYGLRGHFSALWYVRWIGGFKQMSVTQIRGAAYPGELWHCSVGTKSTYPIDKVFKWTRQPVHSSTDKITISNAVSLALPSLKPVKAGQPLSLCQHCLLCYPPFHSTATTNNPRPLDTPLHSHHPSTRQSDRRKDGLVPCRLPPRFQPRCSGGH